MTRKKRQFPKIWIDIAVGLSVTVIGGLLLVVTQQFLAPKPPKTNPDIDRLAHITLDSPVDYTKQQLGAPQKVFDAAPYKDMVYSFDDYAIVVSTKDGQTISTLTYLLKNKNARISIIAPPNNPHLVLGEATFGGYADRSTCAKLTEDTYGKRVRFYCDVSFGAVGNYWRYRLGSHNDTAFIQNLSSDSALHKSLSNTGIIAKQPLNFVSVARNADDLDMFYDDDDN